MDKKKGNRDPEKFIEQFVLMIHPHIYKGCKSMYDEAVNTNSNESIKTFKFFLKSVPNWTDEVITSEVKRIYHETNMNEYLTKLFNIIMKTIILNMTGMPNNKKNNIECPSDITLPRCIHKTYIKTAEELFANPGLFANSDEDVTSENERIINNIIKDSIRNSISALTPIEYILDNFHGLDTEVSEKKPIIIQQGGFTGGIQFTPQNPAIDSDGPIVIDDESIQDIDKKDSSDKKPVHPTSIRQSEKQSEKRITKQIDVRAPKPSNTDSNVRHIKKQPIIRVSDIPSGRSVEESEAYHKYKTPPIDVFSNKVYSNEVNVREPQPTTEQADTEEIKRYALNHPQSKMSKETDNNTSIKNYVPTKKINNTRI